MEGSVLAGRASTRGILPACILHREYAASTPLSQASRQRQEPASPHQPFHDSSHGPGPPPNMFRPMMAAPAPPRMSSANGVLALTSPPSSPWLSRNALSGTSQSWSSSPPTPSGCSGDWSAPATKPSIDIVMFSFSLLIDPPSVDMLVGPPSASEVIGQARSLTKLATTGQSNRQRPNAPRGMGCS